MGVTHTAPQWVMLYDYDYDSMSSVAGTACIYKVVYGAAEATSNVYRWTCSLFG